MWLWLWLSKTGALAADGADPAGEPKPSEASSEIARGMYLWRTGQDDGAALAAEAALQRDPSAVRAHILRTILEIARGSGASTEARYREWWGEAPQDPLRRTALAAAITLRHAEQGPWCEEVSVLTSKVLRGEMHLQAVLVDRERERRCTGETGHADAELRRLTTEGKVGSAEGVLAEVSAGYIKVELPQKLEGALQQRPEIVEETSALWSKRAVGPGLAKAKRIARKAIDAALVSGDPVRVYAATMALRGAGKRRPAEEATLLLASLDPKADVSLSRSLADVRDPEIYRSIDACARSGDASMAADCIRSLITSQSLPEEGSIRAYAEMKRRMLFEAIGDEDRAEEAAVLAYRADTTHRFNARALVQIVLSRYDKEKRTENLDLAIDAADSVLFGRSLDASALDAMDSALRGTLARDLESRGRLLLLTDRPSEALSDLILARTLAPTNERQLRVGLALDAAGRGDEAALLLAYGLSRPSEDTALVSASRDALARLSSGWDPGGAKAMIAAASRAPGDKAPTHPLVGTAADPLLLPAPLPPPPKGTKPKPPPVVLLFTWASWSKPSIEALARVEALIGKYGERGVTALVIGIDAAPAALPEGTLPEGVERRSAGPSAMRLLKSVALPTVAIIDGKGLVRAAFSPYDRGSLEIETALDATLPPAPKGP